MKSICLIAGAIAAAVACGSVSADQPRTDPQAPVVDKPDATLTPRDMNEREQEYLAALKKCEPLAEKERQTCVNAVKSKHGLM